MATDLQLTELVGERLPRPRDVAIDFGTDLVVGERGIGLEVGDRLLARPSELVNAGVDHEATGTPHLVREPAEVLVGRFVDAHHRAQPLGIEPPSLAVAGKRGAISEGGARRPFAREGGLKAVPRRAFVQGKCGQRVQRTRGQVVRVHEAGFESAATAGEDRRERGRHRKNAVTEARQRADGFAELEVGLLGDVRRIGQQFTRRLGVELRIGAQKSHELRERTLESRSFHRGLHLGANARDFGETDVVNLPRSQRQRRKLLDHRLVVRRPVRERDGGQRGARLHQILVAHHGEEPRVRGRDGRADDLDRLGAQCRLLCRRNGGRHHRERRIERVGRIGHGVGHDGQVAAHDGHARHRVSARETGAHVDDLLVERARHIA